MKTHEAYSRMALWSIVFFCIAVVVHLFGYFTFAIGDWAKLVWLPVGILLFSTVMDVKSIDTPYSEQLRSMDKNLRRVETLVLVYVIVNFFINGFPEGSGIVENGRYFLEYKGEVVREIDSIYYKQLRLSEYRLFSGHILIFAAIPMCHFLNRKKEAAQYSSCNENNDMQT